MAREGQVVRAAEAAAAWPPQSVKSWRSIPVQGYAPMRRIGREGGVEKLIVDPAGRRFSVAWRRLARAGYAKGPSTRLLYGVRRG